MSTPDTRLDQIYIITLLQHVPTLRMNTLKYASAHLAGPDKFHTILLVLPEAHANESTGQAATIVFFLSRFFMIGVTSAGEGRLTYWRQHDRRVACRVD